MENLIKQVLEQIGEDPDRKGLQDTPKRVAKMYKEIFCGYDNTRRPNLTVFPNEEDGIKYNQIVVDQGYFFSACEHHMIPFFGQYYFGYIPDKHIIGISKISRLVDWYSSRLQTQERLTKQIVDDFEKELQPKGIILIMKGRHLCKEMRGTKKINSPMTTSEVRGIFLDNFNTKQEFLKLIEL